MAGDDSADERLRATALRNAESLLAASRRAEAELSNAKEALERKTEELQQQSEWLTVTLSSIADAIIATDVDGRVTFMNPVAEALTGWASSEARGHPLDRVFRIVNRETREPAENPVTAVLREARGVTLAPDTALIHKDGSERAIENNAAPLRGADQRLTGAVVVFRDVTTRRRAEDDLREETRILELLNQTGSFITSKLDLQTLVQTVTDAATHLSGARFGAFFYNVIDRSGESFVLYTLSGAPREAFDKFGLPRNTPVFNPTFRGEGVVRSPDITKDPRYGTMSPHHGMPPGHLPVRSYLAVPVVSRSGEVIGGLFFGHPEPNVFAERAERLMVGIAAQAATAIDNARLYEASQHEIARREEAEAALRETDRRKDEFLATLAHELRNPLAPIRQAALISKLATATEAQKRWSHDVISRQVQHMSLLLDDLLDVSRITRGTLQLRKEATDLASVIDAAVETARPSLDAKRHRLSIDVPQEPVLFAADPLRVAQVLSNLLTNAARYTDPEGDIRLVARHTPKTVTIQVIDTGIGIAPEAQRRIFRMFSQVTSADDRSDGGLGIGLALAKGLVELHGGEIEARSPGLGQGSEFTVRLPTGTIEVPSLAGPNPGAEPAAGTRHRVLIADDNRDSADTLAMLLRMEGHEVMTVHDGERALAAIATFKPEYALLDIGMPGQSGYEVARQVRREPSFDGITLIAVTGWGQHSDKARAQAAGFDHHFTKPIEPGQLIAVLRAPGRDPKDE